ncbi:MAG: zinc ribbon domain-containing protein [Steroidobacteraceae bacterium]
MPQGCPSELHQLGGVRGQPANQSRLLSNATRPRRDRPGAPRKGHALLQGIAICGRCGQRMSLHYSGPKGDYPVYRCKVGARADGSPRCQEGRALSVHAQIERLVLEALSPDQIALAVAAVGELESQIKSLAQQWRLKCERACHEVERARRQYDQVEPENRLVARSRERAWEEKLRQQEETEQAVRHGSASKPDPSRATNVPR